tara:strand:- start:484 stop:921 length:438 start_codon:yes stop_codon:yes gene_type:complete
MNKAIEEANKALATQEVPIGAVLVDNNSNNIIKSSHNLVNNLTNATMHAEMIIINEACKIRQSKYLNQTTLFVTLEPCTMCAAAISEVHIKRIYFGAFDEKKGSLESLMKIYKEKKFFTPEIYGGIMENECSLILKKFFKLQRNK